MKKFPRTKLLTTFAVLSAAVLLTGCFETKDEFTLNPDGSGKVAHECTFQNMSLNFSGGESDPQEALKSAVLRLLKELSGHVQYRVATSTKEIDLGFSELKADVKGTELGAQIESIKDGWKKDGTKEMEVKLKISKEALKAVYLVVGDAKTELNRRGYGGWGDSYTFTYESKTGFPANGRLVAEIYDNLQPYDVTFTLENISLMGQPIGTK